MLCYFLLYSKMNQLYIYIYPLFFGETVMQSEVNQKEKFKYPILMHINGILKNGKKKKKKKNGIDDR